MSNLTIVRVNALPAPLVANTIYLVAISATELQVVTVGSNISAPRKSLLTSEVTTLINTSITANNGVVTADIAAALAAAKSYADGGDATTLAAAKAYADAGDASTLSAAAADATSKAAAAQAAAATDASTKAAAAQAAAQTYADGVGTASVGSANAYTDNSITSATTSINATTDGKIAAAIGSLDQSNSAIYAANIVARDALTLTKSSFVFVADATGDATVAVGSALYFYNLEAETFTKVAEYESMDVVIQNKAVLDALSDVEGQLAYKGVLVGTVQAGTNVW